MIPLRAVETERRGFDEPVVEIWRDDDFVGLVFWDGETSIVQIYPDDDGTAPELEVEELMRVLDVAERIVNPEGGYDFEQEGLAREAAGEDDSWEGESESAVELVTEFDPLATHRSAGGEGYFDKDVAARFIRRCEELDLAVVGMEGFRWRDRRLSARSDLIGQIPRPDHEDWHTFRTAANSQAEAMVAGWPEEHTTVIAFVVLQPDGETFVA